ncbi:MAG TPA: flavin reductase family protein [Longimicrobiales bacterium]|nr:flavin reductase family protein [Longimicrobiales bacterium]
MSDAVRDALAAFPYGLYAIGVAEGDRRNAFTANWVTQVSGEPPLVAVAVEADAPSLDMARAGGRFSVTLYDASQRRDAALLARPSARTPAKLADVGHTVHATGLPIVEGGAAWLVCELERAVDAGDHVVLVGSVVDAGTADGVPEPLTLARAGFRYG